MSDTTTKYRTGDLFLANRWSLGSLLNKAADPATRWSDVGIFIVNTSNRETINVMLLTNQGLITEELSELLRDPTIQAAAHRSLLKNSKASKLIIEYLKLLAKHQSDIRMIGPEEADSGIQNVIVSSSGTKVDRKGRDIRVSGFVKGDPNSKLKTFFTPTDLIGSILAHAELLNYDPDIHIKDFQSGEGLLDDYYSEENPLFPSHQLDEDDVAEIVNEAKTAVERLIVAYIKRQPAMNYQRFVSKARRNDRKLSPSPELPNDRADDIRRNVAAYPEQVSNVISMEALHQRKLDTTALGEEAESKTIERKLRQKEKALEAHAKPSPTYKG
jgi:hypothetical protein